MARVTVEDCLKNVENRFVLVLEAAKRAHKLELGAADPMVPLDNDKPTVIALREIAAGYDVNTAPDRPSEESSEAKVVAAEGDVASTVFEQPAEEPPVDTSES